MRRARNRVAIAVVTGLVIWIGVDLFAPFSSDLRRFDPVALGRIETAMWRAYYEKRPVALYLGMVEMLRTAEGFPFFRANLNAYRATRAALLFKNGRSREQYDRARPYLETYWAAICRIGRLRADPAALAKSELEWWIVHRERGTGHPEELARALAATAGLLYGERPERLAEYAKLRTGAMLERDEAYYGPGMSEDTWLSIRKSLVEAYRSLLDALNPGPAI